MAEDLNVSVFTREDFVSLPVPDAKFHGTPIDIRDPVSQKMSEISKNETCADCESVVRRILFCVCGKKQKKLLKPKAMLLSHRFLTGS